jgi:hypothetical protein
LELAADKATAQQEADVLNALADWDPLELVVRQ